MRPPAIKKEHRGLKILRDIRPDPLNYFTTLANSNKGYVWLQLGLERVLFLTDAKAVSHVFQGDPKEYHKSKFYKHISPILYNAMLTSEEDLWRSQRKASAPAFSNACYKDFIAEIESATAAMMRRWERYAITNQPVDVYAESLWLALDVVFRAFFHEKDGEIQARINKALGTMLRMAEERVWRPINLPIDLVIKRRKYKKCLQFLRSVTTELIQCRKESKLYPEDLLSRLIDLHNETPEEMALLRNNVLAVIIAGHETTASNLAWTFFELGRNKRIRDEARAEAQEVLSDGAITMDSLKRLKYTANVLNEALRLYPPVWTVSRDTIKGDTIPFEDGSSLEIAPGSTIMLCAFAIHRMERYWDDPESFLPERHNCVLPRGAFFPFGGGHRTCIGMQFAKVETAIVLARVLERFDISLIPGQRINPEPIITLRPDKPVYCRVKLLESKDALTLDLEAPQVCPYHSAVA